MFTFIFLADFVVVLTMLFSAASGQYHVPIEQILDGCGDICRQDIQGTPPARPWPLGIDFISTPLSVQQCTAIITNEAIDKPMKAEHPPVNIPDELLPFYTHGSTIPVSSYRGPGVIYDQRYLGKEAKESIWSEAMVEEQRAQCGRGTLAGTYGAGDTNLMVSFLQKIDGGLQGKSVVVVGSERPWVEACELSLGARHVTTIEYGDNKSDHTQIRTVTPAQYRLRFIKRMQNSTLGHMKLFDVAISCSSLEHSGLGRYGDSMNPWGDVQAMARIWCMVKPGGHAVIGLPAGYDAIEYNAHRVYGPILLSHLFQNWKVVGDINIIPDNNSGFLVKKVGDAKGI